MHMAESGDAKGVASQDVIRKRAYEIWEQSGRPYGRDMDHWLQAESEQLGRAANRAGRKKAQKSRSGPRPTPALDQATQRLSGE
jgi:hypothetical protein